MYGLTSKTDVISALSRLSAEGSFTIVNETVNVSDGGVSGVAMGDIVEFRPDSTPRGVEWPGFASLPIEWARKLLKAVYGFEPVLDGADKGRLEFSLHPSPRGWKRSHTLYWEYEEVPGIQTTDTEVQWPNDFSRMVGDKVFGLLVAFAAGLPVPYTTVINRRVAPFSFGMPTGSNEHWIRTSPAEQVPGKFTTARGWRDPFRLLAEEDPEHLDVVSVLSQQAVPAVSSGAAIEGADGELIVEGTPGEGDSFMLGRISPSPLPEEIDGAIRSLHADLRKRLGSVRFEWVYDGSSAWILQLHRGKSESSNFVIVPGNATQWVSFSISDGLEALRSLVTVLPPGHGLLLEGKVGITSHIADVVRKAGIPTRTKELGA